MNKSMKISNSKLTYTFIKLCHALGVKAHIPLNEQLEIGRYWTRLLENEGLLESITNEYIDGAWEIEHYSNSYFITIDRDKTASYSLTSQSPSQLMHSMEFTLDVIRASKEGCWFKDKETQEQQQEADQ